MHSCKLIHVYQVLSRNRAASSVLLIMHVLQSKNPLWPCSTISEWWRSRCSASAWGFLMNNFVSHKLAPSRGKLSWKEFQSMVSVESKECLDAGSSRGGQLCAGLSFTHHEAKTYCFILIACMDVRREKQRWQNYGLGSIPYGILKEPKWHPQGMYIHLQKGNFLAWYGIVKTNLACSREVTAMLDNAAQTSTDLYSVDPPDITLWNLCIVL